MKLIESKAELILQQEGLEGVYKQIEFCGRTCYKSEDKIKSGSAKGFVERMINSKHTAMLEQGTVYLKIPYNWLHRLTHPGLCRKYFKNPYTRVQIMGELVNELPILGDHLSSRITPYLAITTNYRVMVENGWLDDLKYLCEPTEYHEKRYTFKFTTDRGVSHELVRHRVFSFAQESTRYCNYSKDKFGNELTFIIPDWCPEIREDSNKGWDPCSMYDKFYLQHLQMTEDTYFNLLKQWDEKVPDKRYKSGFRNNPWTPQQARQILPNALKTEVCMTGFASDWRFFFDLRYYGETGRPHPDMESLAAKAKTAMIQAEVWDDIMAYPSKF